MKTLKVFDIGPNTTKEVNEFISAGILKHDNNKITSIEGVEVINDYNKGENKGFFILHYVNSQN